MLDSSDSISTLNEFLSSKKNIQGKEKFSYYSALRFPYYYSANGRGEYVLRLSSNERKKLKGWCQYNNISPLSILMNAVGHFFSNTKKQQRIIIGMLNENGYYSNTN